MTKVVTIMIVISLAFAICISTILSLDYQERLTALLTFLLASLVDVIALRPLAIFCVSLFSFLGLRLSWLSQNSNGNQDKSLLVS